MKNNLLLLSILLNSFILFAGDTYKVIYGEAYDIPKKHFLMESKMTDEGSIIELYKSSSDITISKFDKNLKQVKSNIIDIKTMPKDLFSIGIIDVNSKHFWLYSAYDKKLKTDNLYALEIDFNGLKFKNESIQIISTDKRIVTDYYNGKFNITFSNDSSKILFSTSRFYPESKDDNVNFEKRAVAVYDIQMKKIFSSIITLPMVESKLKVLTIKIDNDGEVFIVGQVNELGKSVKNKEVLSENTHYEIMKYSADNTSKPTIKSIKIKSKFINSFNIIEKGKNEIMITGIFSDFKKAGEKENDVKKGLYFIEYNSIEIDEMNSKNFYYYPNNKIVFSPYILMDRFKRIYYVANYGNKEQYNGVDGLFILRLDNLNTSDIELNKYLHEIPNDVIKAYASNRELKKLDAKESKGANIGDAFLRFSDIINFNDSSLSVIGEEYWVESHTHCDSKGNCYTTYTYNYNDIIVSNFDKNLNNISFTKIPKITEGSQDPGMLSYNVVINDDKLFIFYLDNLENLNIKKEESPSRFKGKGILVCASVDKNGNMKRTQVLDQNKVEYSKFNITEFRWSKDAKTIVGQAYGGPKGSPRFKKMAISVQ